MPVARPPESSRLDEEEESLAFGSPLSPPRPILPPRCLKSGGGCRILAGELLHFTGTLRYLGSWPLVSYQALREVQGRTFFLMLPISSVVQKTFVKEDGTAMAPNQVAGEILSFFTRNNFSVSDRGETITFEGMMIPSRGQAALLTFCTCISLGSVALVLSIAVPEGGNNWFWLMTLSPLAGVYYWKRASRKEEIKVKMMLGDNGSLSEILVRGDDQQVEQMRKELKLSEKGMIYVKGIFER
ncbi:protein COFACTOR ASSEMBLY OF COMPLEX C SUBUNIT B CCB1, chloroplastic isoform X2 [Typha latifolia]|uniref:protein COFACTOR ASSEMBLY OF COMPLEX C SUBUNIT B CCB1, chloroplastic isoform X2 n=1 Tax=Typha latifolia TaxID=4733 RepID=UPI003C305541